MIEATLPLVGFSRALYSNWLLHLHHRLLFDAGEGLQLGLADRLYVPTHVLLTHGHADHLLGLPGLVAARRFSKGSVDKPLIIVHPAGVREVEVVRDTIARLWPGSEFPVTWLPAEPGSQVQFAKNRHIEAFRTEHGNGSPTLGYLVCESRRRLRAEFQSQPQKEIEALALTRGREALTETYRHILFAHTGDSMPVDPVLVGRADMLVHDATFLEAADRRWDIHATTDEAIGVARDAGVRTLVLHHLSVRYDRIDAAVRLRDQVERAGFTGDCWWLDEGTFIPIAVRRTTGSQ